jgi:hypothetical protein
LRPTAFPMGEDVLPPVAKTGKKLKGKVID